MSFVTLTLRSVARPATIGGACDIWTSGVDGVSIVCTLCIDSQATQTNIPALIYFKFCTTK